MNLTKIKIKDPQSFKSINLSQTNNSKSKSTFSFSKSSRFDKNAPVCPQGTYAGDFIKSKNKGTSIGYGKKSDFTKVLTSSPGSSKYVLKTEFEQSKEKKRGFQMGKSRQKIIYRNYIDRELCRTPSSTRYKINLDNKPKMASYSFRKKTKVLNKSHTIEPQNDNPGPGNYQNPEYSKMSESRFSSSKYPKVSYGTSKSKRFIKQGKNPGPGDYSTISNLSGVGKYIVSSHQGGTTAKFNKNKRTTKFDEIRRQSSKYPGPGSYRAPSQFGLYDGDIYSTLKV